MKYLIRLLPLICVSLISQFSYAQLPYLEDFSSNAGKGVINGVYDTTGMDWSIDASGGTFTASTDYFKINGGVFEAQDVDGEMIWTSPIIDISSASFVDVSVDVAETGDAESDDYVKVYYSLDGGGETLFTYNGENTNDFTSATAKHFYLSGSNLQIIVRVSNNTGTEQHSFDNVSISSATYVSPTAGDIVISEFARHSTSTYGYVEIYNTTSSHIDLANLKVVSDGSNDTVYDFGTDFTGNTYVRANGFLILNRSATQASFESNWTSATGTTVSLGEDVVYFQTGENSFGNKNQYKLRSGGTADTDDGTLLDESTVKPSALGKRVYQMPLGYWTNNEDDHTSSTPGYLGTYENVGNVKLAYADGAWQAATGYAHSAPSSSTGSAEALILRGQATFTDGAVLDKLSILKDAGTSIGNEDITITTSLFIDHDASLAVTGTGSVTCSGSITLRKEGHNLSTDYNVWGSPFSSDLDMETVFTNHYNCDFYAFEASTQSWKYDETIGENLNCNGNLYAVSAALAISTTDSEGDPDGDFDVGRGYFIAGHSSNTIDFSVASGGTLNNGDISVQIFGSSTTPTDGSNDWNLISNPYPSSISVEDFLTENSGTGKLSNAVYLYNPGNSLNIATSYDTYNKSHTAQYIASGQGFYVDGNTTTDGKAYDITFKNSMRHHTDNDFRSALSYFGVYLDVVDENGENDPTRIYFDYDSEDGIDANFDALKLPNGDFNFCSKVDDKKLVFNGFSELTNENRIIPLYFQTYQTSVYTIELDSLVGSFKDKDVLLEDRYMRSFHNLKQKGYAFSSNPKEWANRFYLHIIAKKSNNSSGNTGSGSTDSTGNVTSIDELQAELLKVFVSNEELVVSLISNEDQISQVEVISANGNSVVSKSVNESVVKFDVSQFSKGIYFVKSQLSNGNIEVNQVVIP